MGGASGRLARASRPATAVGAGFGAVWWLGLSLCLGACATPPPTLAGAGLSGRLSVQVAAGGGQAARSITAAFELRGDAERGELQLATPLGTVLATASWSPGRASLSTAAGQSDFDDLDMLAREALPHRQLILEQQQPLQSNCLQQSQEKQSTS